MFNRKESRNLAYEFIIDGKNCITKLSEEDKEQLTSLIIEGHSKFHAWEFIGDADVNNELPFMLSKYLLTRDPILAMDIVNFMVKNAVNHAGNIIVDLLVEQEQEKNFNDKFDKEC